ncbi:MAG: alpha/beta hydrolase [Myxococcota bacterium]|nr:alpha/beta hydrolase [Myxococcota bacterium]
MSSVREFVSLESATGRRNGAGFRPCQGLYHRPSTGPSPRVAFVATHYNVDFSEHYLGPHLAERGFGFLGWNTRFRGVEDHFLLEHALIDIGAGLRFLRERAGVETIVLLGNSGGGSLMAAYQSQAHGVTIDAAPDLPLPDALGDLPAADLYVSLNAHGGRPEVLTAWMDPSVNDESDPFATDASLDMYAPENGPPYDEAFQARYRVAQIARNERITDWALAELDAVKARGGFDRLFPLYRVWADLRFMDPDIDPSERVPRSCYAGDPARANRSTLGIGRANTLRTWLSMWSLRTSGCRGAPHLARIREPSLVVQSLGDTGVFPSDARAIHDALGAEDKGLELVSGAHYFEEGEERRAEIAELIGDWVRARA